MEYKHSFNSIVRYSELDTRGNLSVHGIVNYMQDCSTFESEAKGVGIARLREKHRAWVLTSWNIDIDRYVPVSTGIKVSTWAGEFRSIYGDRNFTIEDADGNVCVKARSLWVYIDTEKRHPAKIDDEELAAYKVGVSIDMEPARRKLSIPDECKECEPFKIKKAYVDTNGHVNNAWYITLSMEYLPEDFEIKNIKVVYQKEITYGSMVYPSVARTKEKVTVVFKNEKGVQHSVVEFS